MPITNIRGRQILDGDVSRVDLNSTTSSSAVIRKLLPTSDASITLSSTGADVGTGDVTLVSAKATSSQLGVIRVGSGLSADVNGILSVNGASTIVTSASSPLFINTNNITIQQATNTTNGYLSSADWVNFNSKQAALSGTGFIKASGTVISYDNTSYTPSSRSITINGVTYDLTANRTWTVSGLLPSGGTAGQILSKIDGTNYNTTWIDNFASQLKHDVKLGATLTKGKAVYVSSADGTNMIVSAASNASEATSSKTLGLLETGGVTNDPVKVITEGLLAGLDTSTATAGDPVWLGTNGDLIFGLANKPVAPAHLVFIGIVTRVQSNNGEIFVKVQNGFELQELHNVLISSVANNEGLFYESSTGLWKNKTIAAVLGYTPVNANLTTNYVPKATGATTLGNSNIQDSGALITLGSNSYVNGSLGIGTTSLTAINLNVQKNITGATTGYAINNNSTILSDVTSAAYGVNNNLNTQATAFTLTNYVHYNAGQNALGAGSSVTNQQGFKVDASLIGATNNYGFRGLIPSGTGRWNIFMDGTANNYMAGSLGIGSTSLVGYSLRVSETITGSTDSVGVFQNGTVQSDVTATAYGYSNQLNTQATAFSLTNYRHYSAIQNSIGAGSSITNQIGFYVDAGVVGAANNYGFFGNIANGSNRWNLFMNGTANNYLAGALGIGTTSLTGYSLRVSKNITGATDSTGIFQSGQVQSDVTGTAYGIRNDLYTQATTFTLNSYRHFQAYQNAIGAGSTVTNQSGFFVDSNLTGATYNYGFRGLIPAGTGDWNLYMDGTASNYLAGDTGIGTTTLGTSTALTVGGTETAASAIARGQLINGTLVASANNDVLVGLDIQPTFTNGAFTGVSNYALRVTGNTIFSGTVYAGGIRSFGDNTISSSNTGGNLYLQIGSTNYFKLVGTNGNITVQNGGTYTDIASSRFTINSTTQGFLPPRMTAAQRGAIASPADGLIVFQTDGTIGLYVYASTAWHALTML